MDPDHPSAAAAGSDDSRLAELTGNLARVRSRIAAACQAHGRDPATVTMIAVTKTFPATDVVALARLGVTDVGENRDQEAGGKVAEVAAALGESAVRWHFVGRLQRNKARSVAGYAHMVHSVDSQRLARALASAAAERTQPLPVLVQVSVDGDPARGGVVIDEVPRVAEVIAGAASLQLAGVMAVAPLQWQPERAYQRLAQVAAQMRADHPDARVISAGMTGDLEAALAHGATHLRIGSALLGNRASLR